MTEPSLPDYIMAEQTPGFRDWVASEVSGARAAFVVVEPPEKKHTLEVRMFILDGEFDSLEEFAELKGRLISGGMDAFRAMSLEADDA